MATEIQAGAPKTTSVVAKKKKRDVLAIAPTTNVILNLLMAIFCLIALFPIYVIVISSLTSEASLTANGYRLWPKEFSILAYTYLFTRDSIIITAYQNTIIATLAGTTLSVLMVALYAYPLSRDDFKYRRFFTFYAFFTMLFGGGLVSYYMVTRQILGIQNSLWALFLPSAFSPFWVLVMRTFYKANIPNEIVESARIDGAGEWRILFQIVMPLAIPGLATVALFQFLGSWNDFPGPLIFLQSKDS